MPEIKVTVSEETLDLLSEYFPEGLNDADKMRIAIGILRFQIEQDTEGLKEYLREEGVEGLDFERIYTNGIKEYLREEGMGEPDMEDAFAEGMKRAILESGDISLSDLASLLEESDES